MTDGPRLMSILQHMGRRNYLVEGLSGTGKTSVCDELQRRGHHAIHGDRELAYRGDPETGEPMEGFGQRRLDERPDDEWGGGVPTERELIVQWHQTKEDVPENGIVIDATTPVEHVVDEILRRCRASA